MSLSADFPAMRPTLLLNFARARQLDPRITFTRASTATYFDSSGVLQTAIANQPRFDFSPTTGESLGLLVEEQRTNSIRNNTMQGAVAGTPGTLPTNWTVTATSNLTTNVIGTGTAAGITWIDVQIVGTASSTLYQLSFDGNTAIAASATQAWTGSFWVAQIAGTTSNITSTNVRISARESGGSTLSVSDSAAITLSSALTRYSSTFASLPVNSAFVQESLRLAITNGAAIDITLRIGLPQLELGAFATSYIPTTTTAVTRNADVASMTGTNFSSWYRADEGTLFADFSWNASSSFDYSFAINDGTSSNLIALGATSTGQSRFIVISGGSTQASISIGSYSVNQFRKAAAGYKIDDIAFYSSPNESGSDTSATIPSGMSQASFNASISTTNQLNGHIRKLAYYPVRLSNAQLQALTS